MEFSLFPYTYLKTMFILKLIKNYQPTALCIASHFKVTFAILASTQAKTAKTTRHLMAKCTSTAYNCHESPSPGWMERNGSDGISGSGLGSGFASGRGGTSINVPLTFAWTADKNCHNKQYNHDDNDNDNNRNNAGSEEDTWRDLEGRPSSGWDSENRSW